MSYEGTFDVVIEGVGAERGAKVLTAPEGLYVSKHQVPYSTLLGVALRGSILLVVGTQVAMALRGSRDGLAALAAELRGRADLDHLALSERQALEGERVVFATPVAVSGLLEMEKFKGLALLVVTDRTLHVFERGGRHFQVPWGRLNKVDLAQSKFGRLLRVGSGPTQLELLYLTDAQIQTIRGLAARHARGVLGVADKGSAAETAERAPAGATAPAAAAISPIEDLARRFVIPEFEASLGSVGSGADRPLGATIDRMQLASHLPMGFLEEHLRELRTIYDGALLKAKREAAASSDLFAAAQALDGRQLMTELSDRVGVIADATVRAFERQTRRVAASRRIPWRKARHRHMPSQKEVAGLKQRLLRGLSQLDGALGGLSDTAGALRPAAERGEGELRVAYDRWQESLKEVDQAYATGWTGLSWEIVAVWKEGFLPRLSRLGGERRRLIPRPLKVAVYFILALVVLFIAYLAVSGQLGQVIQFE